MVGDAHADQVVVDWLPRACSYMHVVRTVQRSDTWQRAEAVFEGCGEGGVSSSGT